MKKIWFGCKYYFKERRRCFSSEQNKIIHPIGIVCSTIIIPFLFGLFLLHSKIIFLEKNLLKLDLVSFSSVIFVFNMIDQSFFRVQEARDVKLLSVLGFSRIEYVCLKECTLSLEKNAITFFFIIGLWCSNALQNSFYSRILDNLLLIVSILLGVFFRINLIVLLSLIKTRSSSIMLGIFVKSLSILPLILLLLGKFTSSILAF